VIILFTGVIIPDYLITKVISDYLSIAFREKLMITVAKHVIIVNLHLFTGHLPSVVTSWNVKGARCFTIMVFWASLILSYLLF
jgi:hypothetical protein